MSDQLIKRRGPRAPYKPRTKPNKARTGPNKTAKGARAMEKLAEFRSKLPGALVLAYGNGWVLPTDSFHTVVSIRDTWGVSAEADYKTWFECERVLNKDRIARCEGRLAKKEITLEEYRQLSITWCYEPQWKVIKGRRPEVVRFIIAATEGKPL